MGSEIKFGLYTPVRDLNHIYRTAQLAQELGFDSVWVPDHLVGWGRKLDALDAWSLVSAMAIKYPRIKLGIGVTDPHRRHPAVLAHQAMTIDQISGGRFMLGIGAGEAINLAQYGIPMDRAASKLKEFIQVVRLLWTKPIVNFEGKFFKLSSAFILPRPSRIPILVAGNAPRTMKLAGELGDGWLPFKMSPQLYASNLKIVKEAAQAAGRDPDQLIPGYLLYTAIWDDREHAAKIIKQHGPWLLLVSPRRLAELGVEPPTWELDGHKLTLDVDFKLFSRASQIPFHALEACFTFGTPQDCSRKIQQFIDAGCRYFLVGILNPGPERDRAIQLFSDLIREFS